MEGLGLKPPSGLQFTGNVSENWKLFKQRFNLYLTASGANTKPDETQASIFLHVIGEEGLAIYNTFTFADGMEMKLKSVMEKFEDYCTPKKNITYCRHRFFTCVPKSDDTIDQYVTELRTRAKLCDFGNLLDSLIRDRIVCGILDEKMRERLLREPDLNLEKAIQLCRANEVTKSHVKELAENSSQSHASVDMVSKPRSVKPKAKHHNCKSKADQQGSQQHAQTSQKGKKCGNVHLRGSCPAEGKTCFHCNKLGHFARCCRSKNKVTQRFNIVRDDKHIHEFVIDTIDGINENGCHENGTTWIEPLLVNNRSIIHNRHWGSA